MTAEGVVAASKRTLGQALVSAATRRGAAVALEFCDRQYSFTELNAVSNRLANAFSGLGLKRHDRICVLAENRLEHALILYAAAKLGVAVSPLNWRLSPAELGPVIAGVDPRLAVVSARHRGLFSEAAFPANDLKVVALDKKEHRDDIGYAELVSSGTSADPGVQVDAEDILVVTHTSGTTGFPKGAALSHRGLIARAMGFAAEQGWRDRDTFIAWSPIFHTGGVDGLLASGLIGGKCTIVDGLQPDLIATIVVREYVNWLFLPPGGISQVVDALRRAGHPKGIRLVGSMADLVPPEMIAETTEVFEAPYFNSFGSTEGGLCANSFLPVGVVPTTLSKRQSAFHDVVLVDEQGQEVPSGEPGEMLLRSPMVFSGYLANGSGCTLESDFATGWFWTGDVMVRNGDGTLDFVERKKYMIKSGGENIYPAEIERLLVSHPSIVEAAVVRKADIRWGEVPVACIAVSDPAVRDDDLRAYLEGMLARYKIPKEFFFLQPADFHRNVTGKIIRSDLETLVIGDTPTG